MVATLATYDPDVLRWGLNQLDGGGGLWDTPSDSTYAPSYTYPTEAPEPQLMSPSPPEVQHNLTNDEAIAHVLQEELTKLAAAEADSQNAARVLNDSQATVLSQDWRGYPVANDTKGDSIFGLGTSGRESEGQDYGTAGAYQGTGLTNGFNCFGAEEENTMGPRKQSSSSGSKGKTRSPNVDYDSYQYGDDDKNLSLALALSQEEQEVAKRLTKLDSIRHIPRINADVMPTLDAASLDHARLLERLVMYGLNERKIQGDGNCQFRALSDQLYHKPEHHKFVRKTIVSQLKAHPDVYSGYVPMPYGEYLKKMAKSGEWGDHVTLQAAADNYGIKIWLITSFKETSFIEILPDQLTSNRVIYLSFWAEVHYNSIYPEGDMSVHIELAPKKTHWLFKPWRVE